MMKASTGMTIALGAAIALGGALAVFNAHDARGTTVRAEVLAATPAPASEAASEPVGSALSGSVLETLPVSKYTYLRLSTSSGEVWAAVPSASVVLGTQVAIENATAMPDFKSTTLNRTFKLIYFGTLASAAASAGPAFSPADILDEDEQDLPAGHPAIGAASVTSLEGDDSRALPAGHPDIGTATPHGGSGDATPEPSLPALNIAPARGGNAHNITELGALRQKLAGQRVRVRGQVTKVTPHVQGHTFLHIRDGNADSGGSATDLVVTSTAEPERGQVATFEGTLRSDVDIGIGYTYPVLLENAVLVGE